MCESTLCHREAKVTVTQLEPLNLWVIATGIEPLKLEVTAAFVWWVFFCFQYIWKKKKQERKKSHTKPCVRRTNLSFCLSVSLSVGSSLLSLTYFLFCSFPLYQLVSELSLLKHWILIFLFKSLRNLSILPAKKN